MLSVPESDVCAKTLFAVLAPWNLHVPRLVFANGHLYDSQVLAVLAPENMILAQNGFCEFWYSLFLVHADPSRIIKQDDKDRLRNSVNARFVIGSFFPSDLFVFFIVISAVLFIQ